ncbi:hypothetical protein ACFV0T_26110 [Streptomyces sp. NPDC059582]|uniref:hypothetical protein n=1 Tax=Streptomyces sp. NPDC059582 TaxID=3346875 RepID=UPI0036A66A74
MTAPEQPAAHGVRIDAQPGSATISIDGTPLPAGQVIGYQLEHSVADSLPMLILHTRQADHVAFEGLARIAVSADHDPGDAIAAFLEGIDPAILQRAALDRDDLDGSRYETTAAILRQLAEWAKGGN